MATAAFQRPGAGLKRELVSSLEPKSIGKMVGKRWKNGGKTMDNHLELKGKMLIQRAKRWDSDASSRWFMRAQFMHILGEFLSLKGGI